jgi:hypothetical protein
MEHYPEDILEKGPAVQQYLVNEIQEGLQG